MRMVSVPLYQKLLVEKQYEEQVVGELQLTSDHAEVTYNQRDSEGNVTPRTIKDSGNMPSLNDCFQTSRLWMTNGSVIWINCKDFLLSIQGESKPIYMNIHKGELEDALEVFFEPLFS